MTTPVWQPGTLYPPGSLVQPVSAPTPVNTAITNPSFESGDVSWDKGTGWTIGAVGPYQGANAAQFNFTGTSDITSAVFVDVSPGQSITCSVMVQQGASSSGQAGARVVLKWYDATNVFISESLGSQINDGSGGAWGQSTLTATAPAGSAKVKIAARAFRSSGSNALWVDVFAWNYTALVIPTGLVYRAVQAVTGASASIEPVWPTTLGLTVVDGDVTWEAVQATRVTWEANPIFLSGGTEPTWPTRPGEFVLDGSFQWEAISRYVADTRSPNTIPVAILATHVFAGDDDIIKFSASTNALDWTTARDAGYLPSGLQQANSNEMAVLAPYRGNLAAFNASSFQLWQADPDPEAMYLLDQQDGIGSIWPRAAVAISSDLYYLAALGVRTVSQAAGNNSLNSGDVGMPVDDLAQQYLAGCVASGAEPIAAYYPSLGQYLIAFRFIGPEISGPAPNGSIGALYSHTYSGTGGTAPLVFSLQSGSLPLGLSLSSGGILSGTPTTEGSSSFVVRVTDANGLYDDLPETVEISGFILATNSRFYIGNPAALLLQAGNYGFTSGKNRVRISPTGQYVAGINSSTGADRLEISKYDPGTGTWSLLAGVPATLPVGGGRDLAWHPSGDYLAVSSIGTTALDSLKIYKRVGDAFTPIADPADPLAYSATTLAWDSVGARIAIQTSFSGERIVFYAFDATTDTLGTRTNTGSLGANDQDFLRLNFQSGAGSLYMVGSGPARTVVFAVTEGPIRVAATASGAAGVGCFFTANNDYVVVVGNGDLGVAEGRIFAFDGTLSAESLALSSDFATQPSGVPIDASISPDKQYLAIGQDAGNSPQIYDLGTAAVPVATKLADPETTGATVSLVSWGREYNG